MRDSRNQIAEVDDFTPTPLDEATVHRVRKLAATFSKGTTDAERAADARELIAALGLLPAQLVQQAAEAIEASAVAY